MKRRKSQLKYSLPQQCSRVVFVGQDKCFFPVNEEEAEAERDEIRTRMQSSIAVEQSCSCEPRQLFLYTELGGEGRRRR